MSGTLIQIKRSGVTLRPTSLRIGELAYSFADSSRKLFIGTGNFDPNTLVADSIQVIGGEFYTELLDVDSAGISDPSKFLLLGDSRNTDFLKVDSAFVIPFGPSSTRLDLRGSIRFNTEDQVFEGYDGTNWSSLGGVRDVDQDTFIKAQDSAGADNDELDFFTAGSLRLTITPDGQIVSGGSYVPDSTQSLATKDYVDNVKAGRPSDFISNAATSYGRTDSNGWADGAFKGFRDSDKVVDVLDGLNEAINNVRNNVFVRDLTFTANPTSGGAGFVTTLNVVNDGNPNRYDIDWGDGAVDSAVSISSSLTHTYSDTVFSPATIKVRAYNTDAYGTGSENTRIVPDYITIYTPDPVANFKLYRGATGYDLVDSTQAYVIEGNSLYLENTTTNTVVSNAQGQSIETYTMLWADGTSIVDIDSDRLPGGVQGTRLQHTWGTGTNSGTGMDITRLTLTSHTTADPAVIPNNKELPLKVYDPNIVPPEGLSFKTISMNTTSGLNPKLAHSFTDNTGGAVLTAGSDVSRVAGNSGAAESTIISTLSDGGKSGNLRALVDGATDGSIIMTSSNNSGTYQSLVITENSDFQLFDQTGDPVAFQNSIYHPDLYSGFKAKISSSISALSTGLHSFELNHSIGGSTNKIEFVKDDLTATPTLSNGTLTNANIGSPRYISGIPYFNTGGSITVTGIQVTNFIGQAYNDTTNILRVQSGTNYEGTSSNAIQNHNFTYAQIDGSTTFLNSGIPIANTGNSTPYTFGDLTVNINQSNVRTVEQLKARATNVNGNGSFQDITGKLNVHSREQFGISEIGITVSSALGQTYTDNGVRIFDLASININTPSYNGSTNFYTSNVYTEAADPGVAGTQEATLRFGEIKHDLTDYSTGYLPVGPDRSSDTGTQYFTFAFRRTVVANFTLNITSDTTGVAGIFIAAPGSTIDNTSSLNGWLDCSLQYAGAGVPGVNTGAGGNGSDGCAQTGSDIIQPNTQINGAFTMTLGSENMTNATGNVVLIRIALNANQKITALTIS